MSSLESVYTSYKCKRCKKETILITEEIEETLKEGRYITCAHCGNKKVVKEKVTDNLKDIMKESSYKRVNGALRQK